MREAAKVLSEVSLTDDHRTAAHVFNGTNDCAGYSSSVMEFARERCSCDEIIRRAK
jgi:hypothetical protein